MDWQQIFYLLGTILFTLALIVFITILILTIVFYRRYKRFLKSSKQKVAQFKGKVAALPFLPILGYFIKRLHRRKRRRVEEQS
jgi:hypothetical protein